MKPLLVFILLSCSIAVTAQKHVFYLHGRIVEVQGANAVETTNGYGAYLYQAILDSLKAHQFIVHSEVRAITTEVIQYAEKIKAEIQGLIDSGVKASDITVIGASKGGEIALQVSALMQNEQLNFVILAACYQARSLTLAGNVLSIYETSDVAGSCRFLLQTPNHHIAHFKEISLSTGRRHGFLYTPRQEWLKPSICWALGDFDACQQKSVH
jgi:hypothetical protein